MNTTTRLEVAFAAAGADLVEVLIVIDDNVEEEREREIKRDQE